MVRLIALGLLVLSVVAVARPEAPARAAFPGANGKIAFARSEDDFRGEIYVMDADGGGLLRLTNNPALDGNPAWSPAGGKIAFQSDRDGEDEIFVMNADGSGVTQLTRNGGFAPAWSPAGTQIAFSRTTGGGQETIEAEVWGM